MVGRPPSRPAPGRARHAHAEVQLQPTISGTAATTASLRVQQLSSKLGKLGLQGGARTVGRARCCRRRSRPMRERASRHL
jgi:hypothetical protein